MQLTIDTSVVIGLVGAASGAALTAVTIGVKVRSALRQWKERAELFWLDWQGVPDRPGVPGRAGLMVRVASIEGRQAVMEAELRTNGGASLKDSVKRIEERQKGIAAQLDGAHVIALPAPAQPAAEGTTGGVAA